MKCPYCSQEHPADTKFCPETGEKIKMNNVDDLIACNNPMCEEFGKKVLPFDSNFCPVCGSQLIKKDPVIVFKSFWGITLGETNIYDIDSNEYYKDEDSRYGVLNVISIDCYSGDGNGCVSYTAKQSDRKIFEIYIDDISSVTFPKSWIEVGINPDKLMLSLERILGRDGFELVEFSEKGEKSIFGSKLICSKTYLVVLFADNRFLISLCTEEMKNSLSEKLIGFS